jgi:general stress protein 26
MEKDEARYISLQLMEVAKAAYLTTIDIDGHPQTRAMFNLRNIYQFPNLRKLFYNHRADFLVLFTTNTSSIKVVQARNNPATENLP